MQLAKVRLFFFLRNFESVTLERNVTERSSLGGWLKSLEAQEAIPGFMFDGERVIGGEVSVGGA